MVFLFARLRGDVKEHSRRFNLCTAKRTIPGYSSTRSQGGERLEQARRTTRSRKTKQRLTKLTYHRVRRIEDIPEVVLNTLPEQQARTGRIQSIIFVQPAQHLGRGVLYRLVER